MSTQAQIPQLSTATYRLQFRNGMTFDRAIGLIPHLKALGISHLYASPIFAAVEGSTHGYDVTDPNLIDPELGGMDGFIRLSHALTYEGLGLILDIVPNHLAASLENPWWASIVKLGADSPYASYFDTDWAQRLTLPVLTAPLEEEIREGHGRIVTSESGELAFDYHGTRYPLHPDTELDPDTIDGMSGEATLAILHRQPWRMIQWNEARNGLSYRRFFEVTGLVGMRVERKDVFEASHRTVLELVHSGHIHGLRIDHIDGLADPAAYLKRLRKAVGPDVFIVVEKILEGDERLPDDWPISGTTGYEFITAIADVLTEPNDTLLDEAWRLVAPDFGDPDIQLDRAKRQLVDVNFNGEVEGLRHLADELAAKEGKDFHPISLERAISELLVAFPVYRTYGSAGDLPEREAKVLEHVAERASAMAPEMSIELGFLREILLGQVSEVSAKEALRFRTRLQHLTGPILAKSLEDTFFYRYNRLIALNEVGGDPIHRQPGVARFHARMLERLATQPHGLTTTSTHDTKRGEDARARLYTLSEAPEIWAAAVDHWRQINSQNIAILEGGAAPEPAVEWLLYQALAGVLPLDFDPRDTQHRDALSERFVAYAEKALREAKLRTDWSAVDEDYEAAVKNYAARLLDKQSTFLDDFLAVLRPFSKAGIVNSLSQTLLKLTAPGIPDIYQGCEGLDFSLVDPDNRRMLNFSAFEPPASPPGHNDPIGLKTWLIAHILGIRRDDPELFAEGDYVPLDVTGSRKDHVIAFARCLDNRCSIVVVPRLVFNAVANGSLSSSAFWGDTAVSLGNLGRTRIRLEGEVEQLATLPVAKLFETHPFAIIAGQLD